MDQCRGNSYLPLSVTMSIADAICTAGDTAECLKISEATIDGMREQQVFDWDGKWFNGVPVQVDDGLAFGEWQLICSTPAVTGSGGVMVDFAHVPISGIWLRKKGKDLVEVLIKTRAGWNVVGKEYFPAEVEVSHIWELPALRNAPPDKLTKGK